MITNELKGRSAFFSPQEPVPVFPSEPAIQHQDDRMRTPERVNTRTDEQANTRMGEHPKSHSGKRAIKRQSYNVYQDQHLALQRLEATSALSGKSVFISEMVRNALDKYLQENQ